MTNVYICNPRNYSTPFYRFETEHHLYGMCIPDWAERGLPELDVSCETYEQAVSVWTEYADYLKARGYELAFL